jgi:hypothetical protein
MAPAPAPLRLTVTLQTRGPAAAIVLTDEQVAALAGGAKAFAVKVTVNGEHALDLRVARMGGENLIGFNKAVRAAVGAEAGDTIEVVIAADAAPRTVEVPDDLADAMATAGVTDRFEALAPSHRKEYVRWITEAKRPETRAKRVTEALVMIAEGKPRR